MKSFIKDTSLIVRIIGYLSIILYGYSIFFLGDTNNIPFLKLLSGSISILFFPGYLVLSHFAMSRDFDIIEKIIISLTLSFVIVPMGVFYLNLIGGAIDEITIYIFNLILILLLSITHWFFGNSLGLSGTSPNQK